MNDFRIVLIFIPPVRRSSLEKFFKQKATFAQILDIDTMLCTNLHEQTIQDVIANNSRQTLQDKWNETLDDVFKMMKHNTAKKIKIILCHPVYYKINTREFFSVFNSGYFTQLSKAENYTITHTVHIIDDIYDVLARLQESSELFGDAAISEFMEDYMKSFKLSLSDLKNNQEAYVSWIQHCVNSIISWRSQELLITQNTAYNFGSHFMLWAIKQDPSVLLNWIKNQGEIFYMSHPISDPRRLHTSKKKWPPLVSQLNKFQSKLRTKNVFSVMPTAIDEYRFEKNNAGYTGKLTARWPIQNEVKKQFATSKLINNKSDWTEILSPKKIEVKGNLDSLECKKIIPIKPIQNYVNATFHTIEILVTRSMAHRDHTLVWHTDGVIVLEPFDAEKYVLHGGVNKELDYVRGVNESIDRETRTNSGGNPVLRKIIGIFLHETVQKIMENPKFFSEYLMHLQEIIAKNEIIGKEIVQYLIDSYGNLDQTPTSLGGRLGATKKTKLINNFLDYQKKAISTTFLQKCLVMTNDLDHIDIIVISNMSQINNQKILTQIQNFLINNKKSSWDDTLFIYAKKASSFSKTKF